MQKMRREQRLAVILKMNRAGIDCSLYAYSWAVDCENKMPGPALELVNIALKNQPRNAVYIAERGIIQAKLGNSKNALSDINAALSLEPDYYPAHVDKGAVLADYFGDTRAACGEYRRGLALCLANRNQDCGGIKIIMSEIPNCR